MDYVGLRLVRSIIAHGSVEPFTASGLTEFDVGDEARECLKWVQSYAHEHAGKMPTCAMVEENIGGVTLPEVPDEIAYIIDTVRKRRLGKILETTFTDSIKLIESRNPDAVLDKLRELISKEAKPITKASATSFKATAAARFESYLADKKIGGLVGLPTPWPSVNDSIQGWVNGSLHVITAMMNVGKTWSCCVIAEHALKSGRKVLFVTLEMATARILRRIDAIHNRIPFGLLRDCKIDEDGEEAWKDEIARDLPGDIIVADKKHVRYVSDVVDLIRAYEPELVVVDGGYRFEVAGKPRGNWESAVTIVNELQLQAELTGLPWIVSTQQGDANETGKDVRRGKKMRAWGVRYGKEWVINPDVVIGLYQNDDLRLIEASELHLLKVRDSDGKGRNEIKINWNLTTMNFSELAKRDDVVSAGATEGTSVEISY